MSKSPIERAARALCKLDGHPENTAFEGAPMWRSYLPQVRSVLQAIREPSDHMCLLPTIGRLDDSDAEQIWTAMIDAALDEAG